MRALAGALSFLSLLLLGAPCATTQLAVLHYPPYEDGSAYPARTEQDQGVDDEVWETLPGALEQGDCILGERAELLRVQYCVDTTDETGAPIELCSGKPVPCCHPQSESDPECPWNRACGSPAEICARLFLWPDLLVPAVVNDGAASSSEP